MASAIESPKRSTLGRWRWLFAVPILYALVVLIMCLSENLLVYHGMNERCFWREKPAQASDVYLQTADGRELHGVYFSDDEANGVTLFLHGNACNISMWFPEAQRIQAYLQTSCLLIDYPGFGRSEGAPSEAGCYATASAAYDWLVKERKIPADRIIIYGESLGGGVAVNLAERREHRALVLTKTFTSLPDVAKARFPWLPTHALMVNRFESERKIPKCNRPVFIAHGTADSLIPFELGQRLYASANEPKQFMAIEGEDHFSPFPDSFYLELHKFLQKY